MFQTCIFDRIGRAASKTDRNRDLSTLVAGLSADRKGAQGFDLARLTLADELVQHAIDLERRTYAVGMQELEQFVGAHGSTSLHHSLVDELLVATGPRCLPIPRRSGAHRSRLRYGITFLLTNVIT